MNAAHTLPDVPAHRVVNRNGILTGKAFFSSNTKMQELLEEDNIIVIDNKIQEFKTIFWNPTEELL